MNIRFLRHLDRLVGPLLLMLLAPIAQIANALLSVSIESPLGPATKHCVFLKLKGGGSLIIALPALLAMRRAAPQAVFTLVCTQETKIYAELTGVFDRYTVITDTSFASLLTSAVIALRQSFRADICIDLEANSILAAVFAILTLSQRRLGLVKPEESYRAKAYTDAISFNVFAPIYIYYDQLAQLLGASLSSLNEYRAHFLRQIPAREKTVNATKKIGIAAFTSDFAPERMMPPEVWARLLGQYINDVALEIILFGSAKNRPAADHFIKIVRQTLPNISITNKCGEGTLAEAASSFAVLDEFWSIDSGLLHIARLMDVKCRSFWGPTNPMQRLRPMNDEITRYHNFSCSPCVHIQGQLPCKGNNLCMKTMAEDNPNNAPLWLT